MTITILVLQCVTLVLNITTLLILSRTLRTNRETARLLDEVKRLNEKSLMVAEENRKLQEGRTFTVRDAEAAEGLRKLIGHTRSLPDDPRDYPGVRA